MGQSAAVHCLECKCVYSVEIVSQEHKLLFLFRSNESSYVVQGAGVGQSAAVHCSDVSVCIELQQST